LEAATARLFDDAKKFKNAVESLFNHQRTFACTLLEVYSGILGNNGSTSPTLEEDGSRSKIPSYSERNSNPSSSPEKSLRKALTPPESIEAVKAFSASIDSAYESIDLSVIDRRIVAPSEDLLAVFRNIRRTMVKRNHKCVDYDRHRVDTEKMKAAPNKDAKDERRMITTEQALQQATHDFAVLNDALKNEIPRLLVLREKFIDPCFRSLYLLELQVTKALHQAVAPLRGNFPHLEIGAPVQPKYDTKREAVDDMINQLQILKLKPSALLAASKSAGSSPTAEASAAPGSFPPSNGSSGSKPRPQSVPTASAIAGATAIPTMANSAKIPTMAKQATVPSPEPTKGPSPRVVKALYDFEPQQPDDLGFKAGDQIEVIESSESVNDWWKGRVNGRVGYFPANYVA
jgi:amphiphysin